MLPLSNPDGLRRELFRFLTAIYCFSWNHSANLLALYTFLCFSHLKSLQYLYKLLKI